MTSHDFDINSYTIRDLESLFKLKHGTYTIVDIESKKKNFYDRIMIGSNDFNDKVLIRSLNTFIVAAGDLLSYTIRNKGSNDNNKSGYGCGGGDGVKPRMKTEIELKYQEPNVNYYNIEPETNLYMNSGFNACEKNGRGAEIIQKVSNPYSTVIQNEYNEGKLNPLYTPVLTRCLNIDTRFRENLYTSQCSNFTFTLPMRIKRVVSMQLTAYELPVSFYGTSSAYGNNFLHIFCTYKYVNMDKAVTSRKTIILKDGNYTASELLTRINAQLQPVSRVDGSLSDTKMDSPTSIFNCIQFSLDIDEFLSGSGKVTIATVDIPTFSYSSAIISIDFDFTLDIVGTLSPISVTSRIGWNLGFIKPKYKGLTTYTSDTLPEPATIRYLYLVVNDFNNSVNNHFVGAFSNWIMNNNILARIPINGSYFSLLIESDLSQHTEPRKYFGPVDINRMQIQLLDDHGRIIDMNNSNFSMCLTFKCLYD